MPLIRSIYDTLQRDDDQRVGRDYRVDELRNEFGDETEAQIETAVDRARSAERRWRTGLAAYRNLARRRGRDVRAGQGRPNLNETVAQGRIRMRVAVDFVGDPRRLLAREAGRLVQHHAGVQGVRPGVLGQHVADIRDAGNGSGIVALPG